MATTLQKLREQGWHLSEDGLKKLSGVDGQPVTDVRKLVKLALDVDLREISNKSGGLGSENIKSSKLDVGTAGTVVQVMGVRNVSAPKAKEESKTAPRMLQLDLTDGHNVCLALEMEKIECLSIDTAPGTKLLLRGAVKVSHAMLMLDPSNVCVVGGYVAPLHERWEHARIMAAYATGIQPEVGAAGPPPWITFGQKSVQQQTMTKNAAKFKSLGNEVTAESKENAEFTALRSMAIEHANKARTKKVFGGGNRSLIDHNVKKIIDKGFTEEEAQSALRYAKNNLERAMGQLKRERMVAAGLAVSAAPEPSASARGSKGSFRDRRGREEEPEGAKPSGKVSLFDFLTDKIPKQVDAIPITSAQNATPSTQPSRPLSNNAPSNNGYAKRSEDNFNYNSNTNFKRHDVDTSYQQRRNDTQPRRSNHDDGPKGYPNKIDEISFKKPNAANGPPFKKPEEPKPKASVARQENGTTRPATSSSAARPSTNNGTDSAANSRGHSSNGAPSTKTVSANNPFSLENRAKFQNDISSSFANRGKRNEPLADAGHRSGTPGRRDAKPTSAVRQPETKGPKESAAKANELAKSNQNSRKPMETVPSPAAATDKPKHAAKEQPRSDNPFNKPSNQRAKSDAKPRARIESPARLQPDKVAQLVKATAALKVSEPARPKPSKSTPAAVGTTAVVSNAARSKPATNLTAVFPNGFEYNPNKIMGFTDKQTNEVAQNMLKAVAASGSTDMLTQLLEAAAAATNKLAAQSSLSPLPDAFVPAAAAAAHKTPIQAASHHYSVRPMTSPQHKPRPQPHQHFHGQMQHVPQFVAPAVVHAQQQQPAPAPIQFSWSLKLHDLCFAKYWEDGRYYQAQITGMSDTTCVVEFLEYGNFEEVLCTDSLPITDDNIQMVNQYNAGLALQPTNYPHQPAQMVAIQSQYAQPPLPQLHPQPPQQQQPLLQTPHSYHQTQQHHHHQQQQPQQLDYNQYNQQQQQQHLQRMRGERQMYVPPAQRSAK